MAQTRFSGPVKSTNGFQPGTSTVALTQIMSGTVSVNPASIAAASTGDTTVTITGVASGDVVVMNPPDALEAGLAFGGCWVSAADSVKVRLVNPTAGAVDGAARNWTYAVFRMA